ncbi:protein immune deficiency [Toxorhynchites rutilus septentrionalis]|uniref:protein immune deficiency n=1 Tax=Toxorhynchites rutilus septentrionalis TaxID=329112 RepID=UPI00247AE40C|nr:protein immune deficiency [Toxorhynchites rutilus septentrionalis]
MAKFKNILSNLFPKSSSKLEIDAAVVPRRTNDEDSDKPANQNNSQVAVSEVNTTGYLVTPFDSAISGQQLQLASPTAGALTQNVVNNVQNNTLTAPQTSITNTAGVQVYQIKGSKNVHIGNSFTFNCETGEERAKSITGNGQVKWANLKLSDTIKQMMECEDDLDTGMMETISRHLGYEWKSFARSLCYSDGQIESFECDNRTLSEQIYHFVLDWTRNDDEPTLGRMTKLLWERKHKETVYHMKILWKKRKQTSVD